MKINLVQGDTGPQIKVTLTRSDTGTAQDLTGSTVKMRFRKKLSTTVLFTLDNQSTAEQKTDGIAIFVFGEGQLDLDEGYYEGEVETVLSGGQRETVYDVLEFYLREDFG